VPGIICKRVSQTSSYTHGPAGPPWSEFGLEQQAAIVDEWFGTYAKDWKDTGDVIAKLATQAAVHDEFFVYIANNIRFAQN
jgi:hypothetical protein